MANRFAKYVTGADEQAMVGEPPAAPANRFSKYLPPQEVETPAKPDPGMFPSLVSGMRQGASLGFSDEIDGATLAVLGKLSGSKASMKELYDTGAETSRYVNEAAAENSPVSYYGGQIGAGIAGPGGVPAVLAKSAVRRVAATTGTGAAYSAVNQFGSNEGGVSERLEGVPEAAGVGAVIGGVLGGGAEGVRAIGKGIARHGTPTRDANTKIVDTLPDKSVEKLADQLSVGAYQTNAPGAAKMRQAFDILGEEMVAAKGDKILGQKNGLARIVTEMGVKPKTARDYLKHIREGHDNGELYIGEYPSVAASDDATRTIQKLDDPTVDALRASEDTSAMTPYSYVARKGGTQGAQRMRTRFDERTMRQKGPIREWMKDAAPRGLKNMDEAEQMLDDIGGNASRAYDELDALGDNGYDKSLIMNELPKLLDRHLNAAARRGADQKAALQAGVDKFYITTDDGRKIAMPTLQILQDQRQSLRKVMDDMRGDPVRKTSDAPGLTQLQGLYSDITDLMRKSSPRWAKANDLYADGKIKEKLMDFGENLTKNPGDAQRAAFKIFDKAAPEAQDWMRVRVLQHIDDMIAGKGDTHDLAKLYTNENWRKIITKVFPRQREVSKIVKGKTVKTTELDRTSENFIRLIRNMQVANRNKARATGNSVTAEMLEMNKNMDADIGMIAGAQSANVQSLREWAAQAIMNTLTSARVRKMEPILSTQARDVPNAAMRVQQLRLQQRRNQAANGPRSDTPQRLSAGAGTAANAMFEDAE